MDEASDLFNQHEDAVHRSDLDQLMGEHVPPECVQAQVPDRQDACNLYPGFLPHETLLRAGFRSRPLLERLRLQRIYFLKLLELLTTVNVLNTFQHMDIGI